MSEQGTQEPQDPEVGEGVLAEAAAIVEDEAEALDPLAVTVEPDGPVVGIIMSVPANRELMDQAVRVLDEAEVTYEVEVMSAHRDPARVAEYCAQARARGLKVIIAGAGLAAALPGIAAAHTDLPVIGVPLTSATSVSGGLDALLAMAQMPAGTPVATVGVDNPKNAAHLAVRILGVS